MAPSPRLRVFLDSNVIFSGLYSPEGPPGIILQHFVEGSLTVVVSQQVLEEVIRTVQAKLPQALPALRRLLVNSPPEVIADPPLPEVQPWTKRMSAGDAAILTAAIKAQPDYLVTGDNHFVNPVIAEEAGLRIARPADFLQFLP